MTKRDNKVEFSLTWVALKLLGKDLYSHPWSAISELVANGIDARATEVYVHIDLSKGKENARLEIYDNGVGMDENGIQTYTLIGYDKRQQGHNNSIGYPMGRKGIGKLAALYLSRHYNLLTKTEETHQSAWKLNIAEDEDKDSTPALRKIPFKETEASHLRDKWQNSPHGTLLQIIDINLKNFGEKAFEGLKSRIADQFLTYDLPNSAIIYFALTQKKDDALKFSEVEKQIASNNFLLFTQYPSHEFDKFEPDVDGEVLLEINSNQTKIQPQLFTMSSIRTEEQEINLSGDLKQVYPDKYSDEPDGKFLYTLSGWIGMHASIKNEIAQKNDDNFSKNNYHNPAQVRLYVRKKLASSNILPLIASTQNYANYIEGEISFDILDHDDLDDIATTSREGFDLSDPRIDLLRMLLKNQIRDLINKRNDINKSEKERTKERDIAANLLLLDNVKEDVSSIGIKDADVKKITRSIQRHLKKVPAKAKQKYQIFLSHASADKPLSDLVWELLKKQGATEEEVFYTSRDYVKQPEDRDLADLEALMHDNITSLDTRILYITSDRFRRSEYCLFEAGAGWATRSSEEYDVLTTSYSAIPPFLNKNKITTNFTNSKRELVFNRDTYQDLIMLVNRAIDHLNKGRKVASQSPIPKIKVGDLPSELQLAKDGRDIEDLYDRDIKLLFEAAKTKWDTKRAKRKK